MTPTKCRHEGSVTAQLAHEKLDRVVLVGCRECGKVFDPQQLVDALVLIQEQNRTKGYPTGMEWLGLVKTASKALGWEE